MPFFPLELCQFYLPEVAISSANCVQIKYRKVKIGKWLFVPHKNCPANGETFASQTLQCINYWSLACKVGKRGGLEKYGQDMKNWTIHPNIVIIDTKYLPAFLKN